MDEDVLGKQHVLAMVLDELFPIKPLGFSVSDSQMVDRAEIFLAIFKVQPKVAPQKGAWPRGGSL